MAQRYGGEFSPDSPQDRGSAQAPRPPEVSFRGRSPQRHGAKINILFVVAAATIIPGLFFGSSTSAFAVDLLGSALLLLAAWLTRDGIRAEDAYAERKVARRPAIPRKIFGSILTGTGVFALAFGGQWALIPAIIGGAITAGLHFFTFGPDPLTDKGLEGVDHAQTDRIARKIEAAETLLDQMKDAILRAKDRPLEARVEQFQATAREMFRTIEEDPRDLTGARRYVGVYLEGARDATVKFADIWLRSRDTVARDEYISLLDDLETGFSEKTRAMLLDDRSDLDVEIEVLRDRLNQDIKHISDRG
ncbi:MAG: 5-bromo-4-chloroindolyl phosphate hydrolysis family protein [Pseudomonadota bacterium]